MAVLILNVQTRSGPVKQGSADAADVLLDLKRIAFAHVPRIAQVTTRLLPFSIGLPVCSISNPTTNLRRLTLLSNCGKTAIPSVK